MKDEPILQHIRSAVFELTLTGNTALGLDAMLEKLLAELSRGHDLPIERRCVIVLTNSQWKYFQVAQAGMEPAWNASAFWQSPSFDRAVALPGSLLKTFQPDDPAIQNEKSQLLLLPLNEEDKHLGYLILFVPCSCQPLPAHIDFYMELAYAVSGFVQRAQAHEIQQVYKHELEEAHAQAIQSLGVASEYRDSGTGWHIMRMSNIALAIAKALRLPANQMELLYVAAPMHDVGKIGIADGILLKRGKLTQDEFAIMKTHTSIGVSILGGSDPMMVAAREIAGAHHERWDGIGYPAGLAGEQIPMLARISAVADVFDALTSIRPYKQAWSIEEAASFIASESGKSFDPAVVRAFEAAMPEILRIRELYRDEIIDPNKHLTQPPLPQRANAWIKWQDDFRIGIDVIDEHHRYLFNLINDLFNVISNRHGSHEIARLLKATVAYAKVHFRTEEKMMEHYGFEDLQRHEKQHQAFETKAHELYENLYVNPLVVQFNALFFLRDWLVHHICAEDIKLKSLVTA